MHLSGVLLLFCMIMSYLYIKFHHASFIRDDAFYGDKLTITMVLPLMLVRQLVLVDGCMWGWQVGHIWHGPRDFPLYGAAWAPIGRLWVRPTGSAGPNWVAPARKYLKIKILKSQKNQVSNIKE